MSPRDPLDALATAGRALRERPATPPTAVAHLRLRARRLRRRRLLAAPIVVAATMGTTSVAVAAWRDGSASAPRPTIGARPATTTTSAAHAGHAGHGDGPGAATSANARRRPVRPVVTGAPSSSTAVPTSAPAAPTSGPAASPPTAAPTAGTRPPTTQAPGTTAGPVATTTPAPTAGTIPPPPPTAGIVGAPVDAATLGTCPAAVHDRFVTTGPDGRTYRTWHPQVVPLDPAVPGGPTCRFAHEHGDDPTTSLADPTLPPFGYVGDLAGHSEPHEGFKVFVANAGTVNDEGRAARTSSRIVFHFGTARPGRFTMPHHSLEFDLVAPGGHEVHVAGMADTRQAGSICERDASGGAIGRTVVVTRGNGCDLGSLYEIWASELRIGEVLTVNASVAAFDPITMMDPADRTRAVATATQYPGDHRGCDREAYHGPVYWYNRFGPAEVRTDAWGTVRPDGPIVQRISRHADIGIPMSPDQSQFKLRADHCAAGLGPLN